MSKITIIYWRDIPTQIVAGKGRKAAKCQLSERFMVAVDKAAMAAGASDTEAYLEGWRKQPLLDGDAEMSDLEQLAAKIEQQYPTTRLAQLARQGGNETQREHANPTGRLK